MGTCLPKCQRSMHFCCQRFDCKIGHIVFSSRFDGCYGHHLPLVLATNKSCLNVPWSLCKSWKHTPTLPRSCNEMVFVILLCWTLLYLNNNHHFLLPLQNPIIALPCCPHMIVTLPFTRGGEWPIARFWSSRCLNFLD